MMVKEEELRDCHRPLRSLREGAIGLGHALKKNVRLAERRFLAYPTDTLLIRPTFVIAFRSFI